MNRIWNSYFVIFSLFLTGTLVGQYCSPFELEEVDFQSETRVAKVNVGWYPGWIEYKGDDSPYPKTLLPLQK